MSKLVAEVIARNLKQPEWGLGGWLVTKFIFEKRNMYLEEAAVRHSDIQPHHTVLEVGFGPGFGLKKAADIVKDGSGTVYGVEISDLMLKKASKMLKKQISTGKVTLMKESVMKLSFADNTFDRVYHVNCYYFWPDLDTAADELYRVMKPDSLMVATRNPASIKKVQDAGGMKYGKPDLEPYMKALQRYGFKNVRMEDFTKDSNNQPYQAIFASIHEKK